MGTVESKELQTRMNDPVGKCDVGVVKTKELTCGCERSSLPCGGCCQE